MKRDASSPGSAAQRESEQGYVLIASIWLLVLAGAVVALLMLSSVRLARETRDSGSILHANLAVDAAVETIVADRIINGDRSIWSRAPTATTLDIDGLAVNVRSTSEADRVDINLADTSVIDAVLRQSGFQAARRQHVLGELALQRGATGAMTSMAEIEALLGDAGAHSAADQFTYASGGVIKPVPILPVTTWLQAGAAQRLTLEAAGGSSRAAIVRVIGQREAAYTRVDQNMTSK